MITANEILAKVSAYEQYLSTASITQSIIRHIDEMVKAQAKAQQELVSKLPGRSIWQKPETTE